MNQEELASTVRRQKEELALKREAKNNADRESREKCIAAAVKICSQVMEQAVSELRESRVVCFESAGAPSAMRPEDWKKVVERLVEIEYSAEFVSDPPDIMISPNTGKFARYESAYTVAGEEMMVYGRRERAPSYRVTRSFVKDEGGGTLAIKVSLI